MHLHVLQVVSVYLFSLRNWIDSPVQSHSTLCGQHQAIVALALQTENKLVLVSITGRYTVNITVLILAWKMYLDWTDVKLITCVWSVYSGDQNHVLTTVVNTLIYYYFAYFDLNTFCTCGAGFEAIKIMYMFITHQYWVTNTA